MYLLGPPAPGLNFDDKQRCTRCIEFKQLRSWITSISENSAFNYGHKLCNTPL